MSTYSMVRTRRLDRNGVIKAEEHAKRLDPKAKKRVVRDAPPITWLPEGVEGDPLAYPALLDEHVKGAFVPKGDGVALHLLVKFPDSVPVETREESTKALQLAVDFAQKVFGDQAVIAARKDMDEASLTNADVLLAPRYTKTTKHTSKPAISLSKHLKDNAVRYGLDVKGKDSLSNQGKALQDAWADFLQSRGYEAQRGVPKVTKGDDWVDPEVAGLREEAKKDREAAARLLAETKRQADAEAERIRLEDRNRKLLEAVAKKEAAKKAKEEQEAIDAKRRAADDRVAAAEAAEGRIMKAKAEILAERKAIDRLRDHLKAMIADAERVLQPIRTMAAAWRKALPLERAAMHPAVAKAAEVEASNDVAVLAEIAKKVSGASR